MTVTSKYASGWWLRGLAMLALLGIMIAPLCGTLCAGNFCASLDSGGAAGSVTCHETALPPGDVSQVRLHSQKSCTAPELPFAILSKNEFPLGVLAADARPGLPIHAAGTLEPTFVPQIAFERGLPNLAAPHPKRPSAPSSVLLI
jgi:hypothetical protein